MDDDWGYPLGEQPRIWEPVEIFVDFGDLSGVSSLDPNRLFWDMMGQKVSNAIIQTYWPYFFFQIR